MTEWGPPLVTPNVPLIHLPLKSYRISGKLARMKNMGGFSLMELLVVIAILAILTTLAVPSFQSMIASSSIRTATNDLMATLAQARSNAIRRGARVTVCKSANGSQCTTSGDWAQGWIVFNDDGHSGSSANVDTGETITFAAPSLTGGIVINGNLDYVSFSADGQPKNMSGSPYFGTLRICSTSSALTNSSRARDLKLSRAGRSVIEQAANVAASCPAP